MKKILFLLLLPLFFISCKKDSVDASSTQSLQSSINDMASSLSTIDQYKFNEALYILKTFGVDADGDVNELRALGKLIDGKKVPQILSLADQVAQKNGIDWASNAPPSMGEMNIFGDASAKESDPNDVRAKTLQVNTNFFGDDGSGTKGIQVVPRLLDDSGKLVTFDNAALETTLEVYSNGIKLSTAKNLMQNNKFKGFNINFSSLLASKISDNTIDVTVTAKTASKTLKMTKVGIKVNPLALKMPKPKTDSTGINTDPSALPDPQIPLENAETPNPENVPAGPKPTAADPRATVSRFLNNVNVQNLRAAYDAANNPAWGSYESFSNPTSGFGSIKNVSVKNISSSNTGVNSANVNATYDVTDKNGKTTTVKATFGLKNTNGDWKISSYKIN